VLRARLLHVTGRAILFRSTRQQRQMSLGAEPPPSPRARFAGRRGGPGGPVPRHARRAATGGHRGLPASAVLRPTVLGGSPSRQRSGALTTRIAESLLDRACACRLTAGAQCRGTAHCRIRPFSCAVRGHAHGSACTASARDAPRARQGRKGSAPGPEAGARAADAVCSTEAVSAHRRGSLLVEIGDTR
jgi:hypothetical protein